MHYKHFIFKLYVSLTCCDKLLMSVVYIIILYSIILVSYPNALWWTEGAECICVCVSICVKLEHQKCSLSGKKKHNAL